MVSMKKSKRQTVIRNMEFNNNDLIGACVHVQRQKTVDEMLGEPGFVAKSRQKSKSKLYRHFDYLLFREIKDLTEPFAFQRRCEAKDITMQCDSDMVRTGKNWGMNTSDKGKAYEIADALAWCNEHGIKISQCRELELADKICAEMRHDMIK